MSAFKITLMSLVLSLFLIATAQTVAPAVVPITNEPSHHMVLDNEYVRVFYVEVPPHGETQYHQHDHDYIFVTLGDSSVDSVRVGEKPAHLDLKDGDTKFTKGGFAHKAVNQSDKPFRNYTIELKKISGIQICDLGEKCWGPITEKNDWLGEVGVLMEADNFSVRRFKAKSEQAKSENASLLKLCCIHHYDYPALIVPISDIEYKEWKVVRRVKVGEFIWIDKISANKNQSSRIQVKKSVLSDWIEIDF